jgi:hypothetical protein
LALSLLWTVAPVAQADEVSTAQARVDRMQRVAEQATAELLAGTRKWEADQARLRSVQRDVANARRRVQRSSAELDRLQSQVGAFARNLAMSPAPSWAQLALTSEPDEVMEALQLRGALDLISGSQSETLRRAERSRLELRREQVRINALQTEAQSLVSRSASRLRGLQALAGRTAAQLDAAMGSLQSARAARAAREARARAARQRALAGSGAACTGKSTSGQSNGNLDPASLCPLWMAPGHRLVSPAAKAFNALSKYRAATVGGAICVTDSYRSYSEQVSVYRRKPGLAAVPGTSEHGWGKAVDLCGGVERFGTSAHQWMRDNAPRFGFIHPEWARQGGSRPEPWHWEFKG